MSNTDLLAETGIRDDERLADALYRLGRRNLVVNQGHPGNKNEWVASAVARQFFLPAGQSLIADPDASALPTPAPQLTQSDSGKTGFAGDSPTGDITFPESPEKPDSLGRATNTVSVDSTDSGKSGIASPEKESVKSQGDSFNSVLVSHLIQLTQSATKALPRELTAVYTEALLRGSVYRQLVPGIARALAAEGVTYLPHLLAHIAYSRSNQFAVDGQQRPGAYVKLAVQERALGDPQFMPPAGLSFGAALAWALRGGHFETDMPDPDDDTPPPEMDESLLIPIQTARGPMAPVAVWQTVLELLKLELSKDAWRTWCEPLACSSYEMEPETFAVSAPSIYVKDWVEARIVDKMAAALEQVLGRSAPVNIEVARRGR